VPLPGLQDGITNLLSATSSFSTISSNVQEVAQSLIQLSRDPSRRRSEHSISEKNHYSSVISSEADEIDDKNAAADDECFDRKLCHQQKQETEERSPSEKQQSQVKPINQTLKRSELCQVSETIDKDLNKLENIIAKKNQKLQSENKPVEKCSLLDNNVRGKSFVPPIIPEIDLNIQQTNISAKTFPSNVQNTNITPDLSSLLRQEMMKILPEMLQELTKKTNGIYYNILIFSFKISVETLFNINHRNFYEFEN